MTRRFVICDIEATGLGEDKEIIEIALITLHEDKIVDVYETLINPLRPVSEFISNLTSISNRELLSAPKFYEVADAIRIRLEGSIFVSHNIEFDYELLKKKFYEMGQILNLKTFCTLKVAQEEIPGLKSYNLDALCSFFSIKNKERHRAIADAQATLALFKELGQLRLKNYPKVLHLPQHEKIISKIPSKAGFMVFKDQENKVLRYEASANMQKRALELLEVRRENRELLEKTERIEIEVTGSALIAEFKKLKFSSPQYHWMIVSYQSQTKEKTFEIKPYKKFQDGIWYFKNYHQAKKKLGELQNELRGESYVYREGARSKEEILKHNQKFDSLCKEGMFPAENLVIVGEGRVLGEKSLILIRNGHVFGFGHPSGIREDEIFNNPEAYLNQRFSNNLSVDLSAKRYLKVLKHQRAKTESWRALAGIP